MKIVFHILLTLCVFALSTGLSAKDLVQVKIVFIEALAPADTTSSVRFQNDYEKAAELAKRSIESKVASCGYKITNSFSFYDASDAIEAKQKAKESEQEGAWLIVGPRRSNHYLLTAAGAPSTPTISIMASADEIANLNPLHVSLSPINSEMVKIAVKETATRLKNSRNKTFIAITSEDCLSCRDFSKQFISSAERGGLELSKEIKISGELPDTQPIISQIENTSPAFILLPSFSKTSAHIMSALRPYVTKAFYVGNDGWGDSKYGFIQNGKNLDGVSGFTVRSLPRSEDGLKTFQLGREVLKSNKVSDLPSSGPSLAIVRIFDSLPDILCKSKGKTKETFADQFKRVASKHFSAPFGVSVFNLESGQLSFRHSRSL